MFFKDGNFILSGKKNFPINCLITSGSLTNLSFKSPLVRRGKEGRKMKIIGDFPVEPLASINSIDEDGRIEEKRVLSTNEQCMLHFDSAFNSFLHQFHSSTHPSTNGDEFNEAVQLFK